MLFSASHSFLKFRVKFPLFSAESFPSFMQTETGVDVIFSDIRSTSICPEPITSYENVYEFGSSQESTNEENSFNLFKFSSSEILSVYPSLQSGISDFIFSSASLSEQENKSAEIIRQDKNFFMFHWFINGNQFLGRIFLTISKSC